MSTVVAITVAVLTAALLYYLYPEASVRWMRRISAARQIILGLVSIAVALVFVGSGSTLLMLIGFAGLVLGFMWIFVEKPYQTVLEVVGVA